MLTLMVYLLAAIVLLQAVDIALTTSARGTKVQTAIGISVSTFALIVCALVVAVTWR